MPEKDSYRLSFAEVTLLKDHLAEVVVDENVEITLSMVNEYHDFLINNLRPPFGLLINKVNSYSYTFEAQSELASLDDIKAMAVITHGRMATERATNHLISFPRQKEWNIRTFIDRTEGLLWLKEQLYR